MRFDAGLQTEAKGDGEGKVEGPVAIDIADGTSVRNVPAETRFNDDACGIEQICPVAAWLTDASRS